MYKHFIKINIGKPTTNIQPIDFQVQFFNKSNYESRRRINRVKSLKLSTHKRSVFLQMPNIYILFNITILCFKVVSLCRYQYFFHT